MSYTSTVYGVLPTETWNNYLAMTRLDDAIEEHRYVRLTERAETSDQITDIIPGAF